MKKSDGEIWFSPSDLITYMDSPFASYMERLRIEDPNIRGLMDEEDTLLQSLQSKGYEHEDAFLGSLKSGGKTIVEVDKDCSTSASADQTIKAMKDGAEIIAQAYLSHERFAGYADFLFKVPGDSKLGAYHYEVWDTKLSKKLKPYFAVQLCCYSEMLEALQGRLPENMVVVLGNNKQEARSVRNYYAYYQALKTVFLTYQDNFDASAMPDPGDSQAYGRWSTCAQKRLENDDHLSRVANITRGQIKKLATVGITTLTKLAETDVQSVPKLNNEVFMRAKAQARIQLASEGKEVPGFEVLPHEVGEAKGLALLPPQDPADIFFDIEGFPLIDNGLEYLWGVTYLKDTGERDFIDFWAHDHEQEKVAFTDFVTWAFNRWKASPGMHIYHYASYEITALRRLMGRYGVCEHEVDELLRNEVFVDLYKVVRRGVLVGEPRYSIKNVEHIYRGRRETEVASGGESVVFYERWRENPDGMDWTTSAALKKIRDYNIDDCDSTMELATWLRQEQAAKGIEYIPPKLRETKEPTEEATAVTELRDRLLQRAEHESDKTKAILTKRLAWFLEFHRREAKPIWWKLFDRKGLSEIELYDDMDCLAGLARTEKEAEKPTPRSRKLAYQYSYDPNQSYKGTSSNFYVLGEDDLKVSKTAHDPNGGTIDLSASEEPPPLITLIPDEYVRPHPIPAAIQATVQNLIDSDFAPRAITDFLMRRSPRFRGGTRDRVVSEGLDNASFLAEVIKAVDELDNSYLCIQGPPGAGKTYTAKHIIGNLLNSGKTVAVSSNSHKAILNLMSGVGKHLKDEGLKGRVMKVGGDKKDPILADAGIKYVGSARQLSDEAREAGVCIGGTAWAFCNEVFDGTTGEPPFDYLFVDEAGQVSLANLVGMSRACKNIVLMGDQMQLGQPIQGSHPDESGQSVLEYLLQDHATIPPELGVFLPKTFRMHPDVCSVVSEQVYEGRLYSDASTKRHTVETQGPLVTKKSGIVFIPVEHEGNAQGSEEEVAVVEQVVKELVGCSFWSEEEGGPERHIGLKDILFVAPYNYQVNLLKKALGDDAKVGSVDKFQGQEAPIVILSMCASNAAESPRGIDFLFEKNRLNVALSRAQALAIVVGSPNLAITPVNNLRQMDMVNFFTRVSFLSAGSEEI
jgi:predicted RecB family nuclease